MPHNRKCGAPPKNVNGFPDYYKITEDKTMKKLMAVFTLLFVSAATFFVAAFSASAAEESLKDVGSNGLMISASAVEGTDYDYVGGVLTIKSTKEVTISGTTTTDMIVVDSENGANITLKDISIEHPTNYSDSRAAFEIKDSTGETVEITLVGDNTLQSNNAGIQKNGDYCKLVINGSGELTVSGRKDSAGIGGANGKSSSYITIGGSVKIKLYQFFDDGAFIGGGKGGNGSYITIEDNAYVDAYSTNGAGIGGGQNGEGSNITISGCEKVDAKSGTGAGIGGGNGGVGSDITITGGDITATSQTGAGIGGGQNSNGTGITISGGKITATVQGPGAGIGGGLNGDGTDIKISGNANVTATSGNGAGIGGGYGGNGGGENVNDGDDNGITISGGTVIANGGSGSAGIGGGSGGTGTNITISGGDVTAICGRISDDGTITAGSNGAGIGGGYFTSGKGGNGSGIKISGGKVLAIGGTGGAGIGGGNGGAGSNIEISGGTVEATTAKTGSGNPGACIGGGNNGNAENIKITGGTVNAINEKAAPAIGSGTAGSVNGIYISGNADVIAAASGAAGIGCGGSSTSTAENIEIFGSAKVRAYSTNHAGIGASGNAKTVDTIKIYGDANVTAICGNGAAGIGGSASSNQEVKNISIYGNASVTAIAGYSGAGIGGGAYNNGATTSDISISDNATVIATGSNGGAGIGSGLNDDATVIASSAYNKNLYDPKLYETILTINGTGISAFANGNIEEWLSHSSTSGTGVGIGSNSTEECVITIEGGNVTAYGNTKPGIGGENAVVTITSSNGYSPIVCTNEIKSTTAPADYPAEYWGIVFEGHMQNDDFMEGIVYGDGKTVDLSKRTEAYTLTAGKTLTVLENVTLTTDNKLILDGSVLHLNEKATLDKWYETERIHGGRIEHDDPSEYQLYDVKDYEFVNTTNYKQLYTVGDKEGIVLCDICGEPEPHSYDQTAGWQKDETHHWHLGECALGTDCSTGENEVKVCSYIVDGKLDYGEHTYDFDDVPEYKDGKWIFKCTACEYEKKIDVPAISLFKVDGDNNSLAGAEFGLYSDAECTKELARAESKGTSAAVTFKGDYILPNNTYYIKETKAPDGYKLSDKVFTARIVIVDGKGVVTYGDDGSEEPPVCENIANTPDDPEDDPKDDPKPVDPTPNNPTPNNPTPNDPTPNDPTPDNPTPDEPAPDEPKPDDNDNPNTGVGVGVAGLALLGGSLCVAFGRQRRTKKKNGNTDL